MDYGNEPAFSKAAFYHPDGGIDSPQSGLTKREYFAAMIMQGLVNQQAPVDRVINESPPILVIKIAEAAVILADAVLKQLEPPQP